MSISRWMDKKAVVHIHNGVLLLLSHFSCVGLCATPYMAAHQASPSLGFSRQEHWNGLPSPSPMHKTENESEVAQLFPTLSDPMDCSLPGSSIHGIFQARELEWGAIAFSTMEYYSMEYYSIIKKNTFESALMRWMKLEPILESEVSQKEKYQYSIIMHIYGI